MKQKCVSVTLQLGRRRRKLIVCEGPIPKIGDLCTLSGQDWPVVRIEDVEVLMAFEKLPEGKLRQVFP